MTWCFSQQASIGQGGQGEILRQMAFAYESFPDSRIYCRPGSPHLPYCTEIPFRRFPCRFTFDSLVRTPVLRARQDWLTLLSDLEFDSQVSATIGVPKIFEGVMGQCRRTFDTLARKKSRLLLHSLNSHICLLDRVLRDEHARLGMSSPFFLHPRMVMRALEEIEMADGIRVLSEMAKQTFMDEGVPEKKIHVIHPSIDRRHFYPVEKKDSVFRVMSSSSIDPRKGIYYLLQAFAAARIPNSELVVVGGTGDRWSRRMMARFVGTNFRIVQRQMDVMSRPVEESFGQASVVAHPALEDGYAFSIPQALASGRPVIATRQSGASELIHDGRDGFVIGARDVTGLKERLQALAADSALLQRMSEAAPRAVAHLDYPDFARSLGAYYRSQQQEVRE